MDLQDKVAVVTGGTKGIGAATAIALARAGADVAIVGRHADDEALATRAAIEAAGRRGILLQYDISDPASCAACIADTVAQLGTVDVLVHSAGGGAPSAILDCTPEEWHYAFDVHVHASYYLCRAVAPILIEKREGAIVLVSSVAGIRGVKFALAYGTVKGAVAQFTRMLAYQLADHNVRVNCVAPGIIRTAFHAGMSAEAYQHNVDNRIPLHREGTAAQVAEGILALVCNDYVTGEMLVIDGGLTSRIA
ncbi:MAG: SDR family oxidoreductase [Anaerolineae bacterium]|nr:SDR family oxidoreductase [Anaerolineae bacterium]